MLVRFPIIVSSLLICGCFNRPVNPDLDNVAKAKITGAITGAGSGAITGFRLGSGTGPGAAIGAGLGAVAGGLRGIVQDNLELQQLELRRGIEDERSRQQAHDIIASFYQRRLELHPTRDIYPADIFFDGDSMEISKSGRQIIKELSLLNENRMPWSRFAVISYIKAENGANTTFAKHQSEIRALKIANLFIKGGIEPRRIEVFGITMKEPILIDYQEKPDRFAQAIEFIPLDN
jgi:outer membrane protein OmpA-like peptidoglycan-associated protein